jgi:hypothetical protein
MPAQALQRGFLPMVLVIPDAARDIRVFSFLASGEHMAGQGPGSVNAHDYFLV